MVTHPILFGDFIKVGADKEDKMYEDLTNIDKVKQVLGDVSFFKLIFICKSCCNSAICKMKSRVRLHC